MPDSLRKQLWKIFKSAQQKPKMNEADILETITSIEATLQKAGTEHSIIEDFNQQVIDDALDIRSSHQFIKAVQKILVQLMGPAPVPPCIKLVSTKK